MKIYIVLAFLLFQINICPQSVYESIVKRDIYSIVERISLTGTSSSYWDVRPLTRLKLLDIVLDRKSKDINLSKNEYELIEFVESEYLSELSYRQKDSSNYLRILSINEYNKFHFMSYYSPDFSLDISPVLGGIRNFQNGTNISWGGVTLQGRIQDNVGFYLNFRDYTEQGNEIDPMKTFSPATGMNVMRAKDKLIDYSETRGGITYEKDWFTLTFAKDFLHIGSSSLSSIILSDKAPSFPHIRYQISPVPWFTYNFIHGWLKSNLIDSSSFRYTGIGETKLPKSLTYSSLPKYYVSHTFAFRPISNLWLTFGESIIYGDKLEYAYFLPLFYRLVDHYNSTGNYDTGDNAQIFFNASYMWPEIRSKLYFTLFIDEMSISEIFGGGKNAQVYAATFGAKITNPLIDGNYFDIEFNAIKPYSYMNGDPLHSYTSSGYQLGHWIGSNAIQLVVRNEQYFSASFKTAMYFNMIIRGEKENLVDYYNQNTATYPLLYGEKSKLVEIGLDLEYSFLHSLKLQAFSKFIFKADKRILAESKLQEGFSLTTAIIYNL